MINKEVVWHIWINLYGSTGLGKSYMIKKICEPLKDFTSTTTIGKLFDDTREIKRLTEQYILNFDELAVNSEGQFEGGLSADQKSLLKSMLTGEYLDTRVYGTQQQSRRRITFSCISSANEHLYDVIFDETSMRRFFDFNCTGEKPENYDEINKWLDNSIWFWKSIDENKIGGYWDLHSNLGKEIENIQKSYYPSKTTVNYWIVNNHISNGDKTPSEIYPEYNSWCKECGYKPKSLNGFIDELKHRLPQCIDKTGILKIGYDLSMTTTLNKSTAYPTFLNKLNVDNEDNEDNFFSNENSIDDLI